MPRTKKPIIEIVAPETALVLKQATENVRDSIRRKVREHVLRKSVDEILTEQGAELFGPEFQPRQMAIELYRRQVVWERRKWAAYFEKWGCRGCGRKDVTHHSTGHCMLCHNRITSRLLQLKREFERSTEQETERQIDRLTSKIRTARGLLSDAEVERIRHRGRLTSRSYVAKSLLNRGEE